MSGRGSGAMLLKFEEKHALRRSELGSVDVREA